jgi:ElaB/YqjD/DUF883 family membrane-anchored ribosome-binding protein
MSTTDLDNDTGTSTGTDTGTHAGNPTGRSGRLSAATGRVRETAGAARGRAGEAYSAARERTSALYGSARERASSAYQNTREGAARAGRRTADEIDANPVGALVAGLAIGALAAALMPRTRREAETFGKLGSRINETAREAARAAREAGRGKLEELGLNADNAKQKLSEVASTTASAAAQRVKGSQPAQ